MIPVCACKMLPCSFKSFNTIDHLHMIVVVVLTQMSHHSLLRGGTVRVLVAIAGSKFGGNCTCYTYVHGIAIDYYIVPTS
jgi:hypothetical protein